MSKVLPILFNTDMVRTILDGKKTVTRRLIKPQPQGYFEVNEKPLYIYDTDFQQGRIMPPYQPGDILYVRESVFQGVGHYLDVSGETVCVLTNDFEYYADGLHEKDHWKDKYERTWMHRRPSIHMPKEAARIWLKVKDVRVERLHEITEEQAEKEGFQAGSYEVKGAVWGQEDTGEWTAVEEFGELWNYTIKKSDIDRYGWDANPWVWVIEFERCEKPEGWCV